MLMHLLYILYISLYYILYSPRRCKGIGLSDGEGMERLWSYLRRFSRMTKEMRPAHHIDVLSGGIGVLRDSTKTKTWYVYVHKCIYFVHFYSAYIPPKAKTSHFKSQGLVNVA